MTFLLYLAGPIAGCTDEQANDWRSDVKRLMPEAVCVDPMRRDYRDRGDINTRQVALELVAADKEDILLSNAVLAYCPFPSVGTSMEIHFASSVAKQVVVVVPPGAKCSPWLVAHSSAVVDSLDDAIKVIRQVTI